MFSPDGLSLPSRTVATNATVLSPRQARLQMQSEADASDHAEPCANAVEFVVIVHQAIGRVEIDAGAVHAEHLRGQAAAHRERAGGEVVGSHGESEIVTLHANAATIADDRIEGTPEPRVATFQTKERLHRTERRVKSEVEIERPEVPIMKVSRPKVRAERQKHQLESGGRANESAHVVAPDGGRHHVPFHAEALERDVLGPRFSLEIEDI